MYDPAKLKHLAARRAAWEKRTNDGSQERRQAFMTTSGRPVRRLYDPLDTAKLDYEKQIGWPGDYPFTRGVHPTGYRGRQWTMRMFTGFGSAEETNARFKYLLEHGQTGLSIAFDLPTLYGFDADSPQAAGEFGKPATAFDGRDLVEVTCTLANLGAYPFDFFAPVVSGPHVAMVATGRVAERVVADDLESQGSGHGRVIRQLAGRPEAGSV